MPSLDRSASPYDIASLSYNQNKEMYALRFRIGGGSKHYPHEIVTQILRLARRFDCVELRFNSYALTPNLFGLLVSADAEHNAVFVSRIDEPDPNPPLGKIDSRPGQYRRPF